MYRMWDLWRKERCITCPRKAVESSGMVQQAILGTINAVARNQTEHLVEKLFDLYETSLVSTDDAQKVREQLLQLNINEPTQEEVMQQASRKRQQQKSKSARQYFHNSRPRQSTFTKSLEGGMSKKQKQRKTYAIQLQEQLQSDIERRRRISKVEREGESLLLMNATNRQPIKPLHLIKLTPHSSAFNTTPLSNYSNPRSQINNYQSHTLYHQTNQIIQPTSHHTPSFLQIVSTPKLQHYNNNLVQQPQTMSIINPNGQNNQLAGGAKAYSPQDLTGGATAYSPQIIIIINPNKQNQQLAGGANAYSPQILAGGAIAYSPQTIRLNKPITHNRTLAGGESAYSPQQNNLIFQENINDALAPLSHQLINVAVDISPQNLQFNNQLMTEQMKNIQKQFPTAIMTQQETIVTKYSHQMSGVDSKLSNTDTTTLQTGELFPFQKLKHNNNLDIAKQIS
ncbi:MAG: hypothetical protein EZS28_037174 [Streblomastix strix]|uniref:Uncharacterized protein n=1 Tax=Streblomastix strix TaxID=222440 RepID=A0A5J4UAS4_9EUKA|nr:MAG: hypothetical protein EZS28_037174 [Streblomastix strix]